MVEKTKDSLAFARQQSEIASAKRASFKLMENMEIALISDVNKALAIGDGDITKHNLLSALKTKKQENEVELRSRQQSIIEVRQSQKITYKDLDESDYSSDSSQYLEDLKSLDSLPEKSKNQEAIEQLKFKKQLIDMKLQYKQSQTNKPTPLTREEIQAERLQQLFEYVEMRDVQKAIKEQEKIEDSEEKKNQIDSDDDESTKLLKNMRKATSLNLQKQMTSIEWQRKVQVEKEKRKMLKQTFAPQAQQKAQQTLLSEFSCVFGELPDIVQHRLLKLCKAKSYSLHQRVLLMDETNPDDLFLICQGEAINTKSFNYYKKFCQQEQQTLTESLRKKDIVGKQTFSSLATVGWVILAFCMRNQVIRHLIKQGTYRLAMERLNDYFGDKFTSHKLKAGDVFGNLTETKQKKYTPEWIIAMSEPFNVLTISNKGIQNIFQVQLNQSNFNLLNSVIGPGSSIVKTRNLSRCFIEREYPVGKVLMQEGQPLEKIYLIKSGECQLTKNKNPLTFKLNKSQISNRAFIDLNEATKKSPKLFALGTHQGDMSETFLKFTLSNLGQGEWVGEESLIADYTVIPKYSVTTAVATVVLEISLQYLKRQLNSTQLENLKTWFQQKQVFRIKRMHKVMKVARQHFEKQDFRHFHDMALRALIIQHPNASKKILQKISDSFQLDGTVHTARNHDNLRIGEVSIDNSKSRLGQDITDSVVCKTFTHVDPISSIGTKLEGEALNRHFQKVEFQQQQQEIESKFTQQLQKKQKRAKILQVDNDWMSVEDILQQEERRNTRPKYRHRSPVENHIFQSKRQIEFISPAMLTLRHNEGSASQQEQSDGKHFDENQNHIYELTLEQRRDNEQFQQKRQKFNALQELRDITYIDEKRKQNFEEQQRREKTSVKFNKSLDSTQLKSSQINSPSYQRFTTYYNQKGAAIEQQKKLLEPHPVFMLPVQDFGIRQRQSSQINGSNYHPQTTLYKSQKVSQHELNLIKTYTDSHQYRLRQQRQLMNNQTQRNTKSKSPFNVTDQDSQVKQFSEAEKDFDTSVQLDLNGSNEAIDNQFLDEKSAIDESNHSKEDQVVYQKDDYQEDAQISERKALKHNKFGGYGNSITYLQTSKKKSTYPQFHSNDISSIAFTFTSPSPIIDKYNQTLYFDQSSSVQQSKLFNQFKETQTTQLSQMQETIQSILEKRQKDILRSSSKYRMRSTDASKMLQSIKLISAGSKPMVPDQDYFVSPKLFKAKPKLKPLPNSRNQFQNQELIITKTVDIMQSSSGSEDYVIRPMINDQSSVDRMINTEDNCFRVHTISLNLKPESINKFNGNKKNKVERLPLNYVESQFKSQGFQVESDKESLPKNIELVQFQPFNKNKNVESVVHYNNENPFKVSLSPKHASFGAIGTKVFQHQRQSLRQMKKTVFQQTKSTNKKTNSSLIQNLDDLSSVLNINEMEGHKTRPLQDSKRGSQIDSLDIYTTEKVFSRDPSLSKLDSQHQPGVLSGAGDVQRVINTAAYPTVDHNLMHKISKKVGETPQGSKDQQYKSERKRLKSKKQINKRYSDFPNAVEDPKDALGQTVTDIQFSREEILKSQPKTSSIFQSTMNEVEWLPYSKERDPEPIQGSVNYIKANRIAMEKSPVQDKSLDPKQESVDGLKLPEIPFQKRRRRKNRHTQYDQQLNASISKDKALNTMNLIESQQNWTAHFATTEAERMTRKKHRLRKQLDQKNKKESDQKDNSASEGRVSIEQETIGQGVEDYFKPKTIQKSIEANTQMAIHKHKSISKEKPLTPLSGSPSSRKTPHLKHSNTLLSDSAQYFITNQFYPHIKVKNRMQEEKTSLQSSNFKKVQDQKAIKLYQSIQLNKTSNTSEFGLKKLIGTDSQLRRSLMKANQPSLKDSQILKEVPTEKFSFFETKDQQAQIIMESKESKLFSEVDFTTKVEKPVEVVLTPDQITVPSKIIKTNNEQFAVSKFGPQKTPILTGQQSIQKPKTEEVFTQCTITHFPHMLTAKEKVEKTRKKFRMIKEENRNSQLKERYHL